ncbi:hypothetical protein Taro_041805 [Colocasia esculenta]|uniref:Uncharacterized protein n=1 Tax=Colocasia esculenta TaxID=4460 RepID=A0A843WGU2_COLES|nr:hypothetical protein [Colocasia esculenta]
MDQQAPVPPVAVPAGDGEAIPVAQVPPRVEVKSRVGPEMKQDLLLFSWSWRPGVAVDWLASRLTRGRLSQLTLFSLLPQLHALVFLKLLTGFVEWLDDHRMRDVAKLREKTSRRGAIPVGACRGLGVNREIVGSSSVF